MRRPGCCRSGRFLLSSVILLPCHALENLIVVLRFGPYGEQHRRITGEIESSLGGTAGAARSRGTLLGYEEAVDFAMATIERVRAGLT